MAEADRLEEVSRSESLLFMNKFRILSRSHNCIVSIEWFPIFMNIMAKEWTSISADVES